MNVRDEAMKELVKGQEFAKQLGQVVLEVMKNNKNMNHLGATQQLVSKVVNSFTNTLFLLNKHHQRKEEEDFSFIIKSEEDSQDSCKTTTSAGGGGRGSNKRRKTTETYEEVSERPTDDGHEWRKYGQKTILNSKYSRDYYRCTHKIDQRCQATKQVQRIEEKPPLYKTTYYGHHTCNKNNIIFEPTSPHDPSSILLSFNNTFPAPTKQDCPFLSIPSSSSSSSFNSSPSLDQYLLSPEPILDNSISTTHVNVSSTLSSSSTTLQSDDHKDMMIMYGLLYDSVELDHDFLHPFHGFQL